MDFEILHLSDLHFGNPCGHLRQKDTRKVLDTLFSRIRSSKSVLVVSGDVTFQGRPEGYREALDALSSAIRQHNFQPGNVLVCPGNHDIVRERVGHEYFSSFDAWSAGVRGDKKCTFAGNPVRLIKNDVGDFLLLNTAYHADHQVGRVDIAATEALLQQLIERCESSLERPRIAVAHHHMIPVLADDASTTRNAHSLLRLLIQHRFSALLHGHQHAMLDLAIGNARMILSGVGSFGFATPGYINSAAIYRGRNGVVNEVERLGITLDSSSGVIEIKPVD